MNKLPGLFKTKKFLLAAVALLAVAGVAGFYLIIGNNDNPEKTGDSKPSSQELSKAAACSLFTLEDAKKILGEQAEKSETTETSSSSEHIEVSQCLYSQPAGDSVESLKAQKQASLLVRAAKTDEGAEANNEVFKGSLKPGGVQNVDGYGEAAFWDPQLGQLNILKNNHWYVLSMGVATLSDRTLEDAKAMADTVVGKF